MSNSVNEFDLVTRWPEPTAFDPQVQEDAMTAAEDRN
jgi:hypothetical protein